MKDVAILTKYYKNNNYGGMLQGYALHRVINELGYSADIISYDVRKNRNSVYPSIVQQMKQYGLGAAVSKAGEKAIAKGRFFIKDTLSSRVNKFERFEEEIRADTELFDDDSMRLLKLQYKTFVSGSDQIWNPNAVRNLYLQTFVAEKYRKISYAASIGRDSLSEYEASVIIPAIKEFGAISVREQTAKKLLGEYMDNPISIVLDPTLLLTSEEWGKVASNRIIKEKYALVYFFSDSLEVRKKAMVFCNQYGLKLVVIPYAKQEYNLTDRKGPGIRINDVGPNEFVSLIKNADFVITDSFHGAVFSLIHRVPFAVFERNKSGHVSMNSRLYDLLNVFQERHRLISIDRIDELSSLIKMDANKIERIQLLKRNEAIEFLRNSIEQGILKFDKASLSKCVTGGEDKCSGCGACIEECPKQCISLKNNKNGFLIPVIDESNCLHCGKCLRICPMLVEPQKNNPISVYGVYAKEDAKESTSGGISHILGKKMVNSGGIVYGAAYDDCLKLKIRRAECIEELDKFRGSKYLQADMTEGISSVVTDLSAGKEVLFTGTPCQVAGVVAVANEKKLREKLITAEIICHGVPSPQMFEDYLAWIKNHYGDSIIDYSFRSKVTNEDKDFILQLGFENGNIERISGFKDPFYKKFLSSRWFRECCYECPYAKKERVADLTMGDFWNAEELPGNFGSGKRLSVLLINSLNGKELFDRVSGEIMFVNSSWEVAARGNSNLFRPTRKYAGYIGYGESTEVFFQKEYEANIDMKKYIFNQLPMSARRKIKRIVGR